MTTVATRLAPRPGAVANRHRNENRRSQRAPWSAPHAGDCRAAAAASAREIALRSSVSRIAASAPGRERRHADTHMKPTAADTEEGHAAQHSVRQCTAYQRPNGTQDEHQCGFTDRAQSMYRQAPNSGRKHDGTTSISRA